MARQTDRQTKGDIDRQGQNDTPLPAKTGKF